MCDQAAPVRGLVCSVSSRGPAFPPDSEGLARGRSRGRRTAARRALGCSLGCSCAAGRPGSGGCALLGVLAPAAALPSSSAPSPSRPLLWPRTQRCPACRGRGAVSSVRLCSPTRPRTRAGLKDREFKHSSPGCDRRPAPTSGRRPRHVRDLQEASDPGAGRGRRLGAVPASPP